METIRIPTDTKDREAIYRSLLPQVKALLGEEHDAIAGMANLAAALHQAFGWHWVGFYRVQDEELVLGPFQGPVACSRIRFGSGVCGTAWKEARTLVVPDVELFPGHIACSALSRSEIVVPCFDRDRRVWAVLDIDSVTVADHGEVDATHLAELCALLPIPATWS